MTHDDDRYYDEPATDPTCVGTHNAECNGSTSPRSGGDGHRCQECREERQRKWAEYCHELGREALALEAMSQERSIQQRRYSLPKILALQHMAKFLDYSLGMLGEVDLDDLGIDAPEGWEP